MTQSGVSSVCTTSTSGMRNGGFHQWVPMMRSRFCGRAGDLRGAHDRRVGRQDRVRLAHLVELLERVLLEGHVLGHALEHEVGVGGRFGHVLRGAHAGHGRLDVLELAEAALGQEGQVVPHGLRRPSPGSRACGCTCPPGSRPPAKTMAQPWPMLPPPTMAIFLTSSSFIIRPPRHRRRTG